MKKATKFLALLLALVLTIGLGVTAFADEVHAGNNGTITIDNAIKDQTYTIYEILYLESYDAANNAYSYKATAAWSNFINSGAIKGVYVDVNTEGYVTWKTGADAAAFAKLAQAYAQEHSIQNQGSKKATDATVKFTNLDLGYYLLDSSLGTLCSLDTTKPDVTIKEKNVEPTNEKEVEEDSNNHYGSVNDADIGQTVNFKSTITAQAGAENYVFHDKMSAGLTFGGTVTVTKNGQAVAAEYYTLKTSGLTDKCTFEVAFTKAFCDTLVKEDQIVISYTATVNANAVIGGEGNPNESKIEYGESGKTTTTPPSTTTTYTWSFDVLKYGNGNEAKVLKGAQFVLLNETKDKVAMVADGKLTGWADFPVDGKTWPEGAVLTTGADGKISIAGLDADIYYLREVKAPDGYNELKEDTKVEIKTSTTGEGKLTMDPLTVKVNNKSGTELPSTGGVGTTVFYVLGGILAVGAAVLLVTKKRMEQA